MPNLLPNIIPNQTIPFVDKDGLVEINWYLFLYNIYKQLFSTQAGAVTLTSGTDIPMIEIDAANTDAIQDRRLALNVAMLFPDFEPIPLPGELASLQTFDADVGPSLRELANAMVLALDGLLPDAVPQAQPSQAVTVGLSPYTFTASSNGALVIVGGTAALISIIRQGVLIPSGLVDGIFPMSRLDQVRITYTIAPTVTFLPT